MMSGSRDLLNYTTLLVRCGKRCTYPRQQQPEPIVKLIQVIGAGFWNDLFRSKSDQHMLDHCTDCDYGAM